MSLAEEVHEIRESSARPKRCKVGIVAEQLGEPDGAELFALVEDPAVYLIDIVRALRKRDIGLSDNTMGVHRRRECLCFP